VGIVGAGRVAHAYAEAFAGSPLTQVVAVADPRPEAARALAERLGCRSYPSGDALAEAGAVDAVVVSTPPSSHADLSRRFLAHGAHVLCEKPFAVDVASAMAMLDAARRADRLLMMASKFRYVEAVAQARTLAASGLVGEILLLENCFRGRSDMAGRWHADPAVSGGGVLIDNGSHSFDLMRYFLGPLVEVRSVEGPRIQGLAVEDTVWVFARSAGGVLGRVELSWSLDPPRDTYLSLHGSSGVLSVGWRESWYRTTSRPGRTAFGAAYDRVNAVRRQIENFARAIRGEEAALVTGEDALASVEAVASGYAALRAGQWTRVGETEAGAPRR
jgi:predicted dehydrogenase